MLSLATWLAWKQADELHVTHEMASSTVDEFCAVCKAVAADKAVVDT